MLYLLREASKIFIPSTLTTWLLIHGYETLGTPLSSTQQFGWFLGITAGLYMLLHWYEQFSHVR